MDVLRGPLVTRGGLFVVIAVIAVVDLVVVLNRKRRGEPGKVERGSSAVKTDAQHSGPLFCGQGPVREAARLGGGA